MPSTTAGPVVRTDQRRPRPAVMLLRGLLRRCPNCGGGRLFRRWFTMKAECPTCGLRFERDEGFFLGAYTVNFGIVLITLAAWILGGVILTLPDPPVVALVVGGMLVSSAVALFFYPISKTFWSAIDLIMTPAPAPASASTVDGAPRTNR